MKIFSFKTYDEFLERFEGEIYAIENTNRKYLCDLHENDLLKLVIDGKIISKGREFDRGDYILASEEFKQEILQEAILIKINE